MPFGWAVNYFGHLHKHEYIQVCARPNIQAGKRKLNGMIMLSERLKIARESIAKSQKEMAEALGVGLKSWQVYEQGSSVPGGNVFESLVKLGFNANWLLTGEGDMRVGGSFKHLTDEDLEFGRGLCQIGEPVVAEQYKKYDRDDEAEELCRLLKRYGNKAMIEDLRARLLKIKQVVEG